MLPDVNSELSASFWNSSTRRNSMIVVGPLIRNKNGCYQFEYENPMDVTYIAVYHPKGNFLGNIHRESGSHLILAYQQKLDQFGMKVANEFMYGVMQGIAHHALYADLYPKCRVFRRKDQYILEVTNLDGTVTEKIIPPDSIIVTPGSHLGQDAN
jgi:hypothetical protein